jgi:hypothetical protein
VIPENAANTQITSILTVDDLAPGTPAYPMAGIPDGLGAYQDGNSVTFLSNHELGNTQGVVRSHGAIGAFVSQWTLDPATLDVTAGKDAITTLDYAGTTPPEFAPFCSANLAVPAMLYNTASGNGYNGNLFLNGEEGGLEGRAVATDPLTGNAWVLPDVGRVSWENALPAYTPTSDTTLLVDMNDSSTAGQTANLIYVGTKKNAGAPYVMAGLTGGTLYAAKLATVTTDAAFRTTFGVGSPQAFTLVSVSGATGAALQADALAKGAFGPDRTEDGAWDPQHPNDFYFVTTGSTAAATGRGGLWRMRFTDVNNPTLGGTLTLLVDHPSSHLATDITTNQPGFYMPDNMGIDGHGHILIQEDPGGDNYIARIFAYDIATNQLKPIATFDPARFGAGAPGFITNDEESSGIIDLEGAGLPAGTFLLDAQVHTATGLSNATRDAERGQYMVMNVDFANVFPTVDPVIPEAPYAILLPAGAAIVVGGWVLLRRRRSSGPSAAS